MSKRKFGTIKSLLHFDYPYFNEPNDGLGDEIGLETWSNTSATLCGNIIPYASQCTPKFGYRCLRGAITGTNNTGIWNLDFSGNYEIEVFVNPAAEGRIFALYDDNDNILLKMSVKDNFSVELADDNVLGTSEINLTSGTWQHMLLRITNSMAKIFLDGTEILSISLNPNIILNTNYVQLGDSNLYLDEFVLRHSVRTGNPSVPTKPYTGILSSSSVGGFGTGSLGDITISENCQINSYGIINSITDAKTFSVSSWSNGIYTPAVGDEVMIHVTAPRSSSIALYPLVGLYDFGKIASLDGTSITLESDIDNDFTLESSILETYYIQIITVPNFNSLKIEEGITVKPLTLGASTGGGIVAFRCKGDCTINGSILTHGYGAVRYDMQQMTHAKLVDRFLCAGGGGIFATVGGTMTTSEDARLGASWSGEGENGNGGAGYGGYGGATMGVGGGGAAGTNVGSNGSCSGINSSYQCHTGGGGSGGNGVDYHNNNKSGNNSSNIFVAHHSSGAGGLAGDSRGVNGYPGGNMDGYTYKYSAYLGGGGGGGAPGGNGSTSGGSSRNTTSNANKTSYYPATGSPGVAGACILLIVNILNLTNKSISTGGQGGSGGGSYRLAHGSGGTGFCYIAAKEVV